jgi:DNA-binding HxlR family transcriptional regulator
LVSGSTGGSTIAAYPPPKRHPYDQWSPDARALDLVGDKWTLLIVRDLAAGPQRFVELQRRLPGISTEQLRSRLNRMVADGLLTRQRYREVPPRVDYELTVRARDLMPVLGALARWGQEWAWGSPRPGEDVDVGALLRLAPGLVQAPRSLTGTVAVAATAKSGTPRDYLVTFSRGRVELEERSVSDADARVSGGERDWIEALGPEVRRDQLQVSGEERLVDALLDGLVAQASRRSRAAA